MPIISTFYGIIIRMFYFDTTKHKTPHIHVQYAEWHAVIKIPDGTLIEGKMKPEKLKLVQAWIEIHRNELMEDWKRAIKGQPVSKISPLR